jgi:hypothetical protein
MGEGELTAQFGDLRSQSRTLSSRAEEMKVSFIGFESIEVTLRRTSGKVKKGRISVEI